ncbi:MAG: ABC transporter substrate-binding protein [Gaiellales bacterium]
MRRFASLLSLAAALAVAAGCGSSSTGSTGSNPTAGAGSGSGASCTAAGLQTLAPGKLTIGTDNPAYSPYFTGGAGHEWKGQFNNDPYTGKGFEDAVAYAVAKQLGFGQSQVVWSVTPFNNSFKPGPKNFDLYLAQVSYNAKRARNVDLSGSYYDVNQALVALKGKPIDHAASIADLKSYKLGVQIGTTNYDYVVNVIKPSREPSVYTTTNDAISALKGGQIDGLVVDFPTAYYIANVQLSNGYLVGQFASLPGTPEHFSLVLSKDSSLTPCVNKALSALRASGTLGQIQQEWLSNVAQAPVLK